MNKTAHYGGMGGVPPFMVRMLTRSFDTLEAAQKFAEGKDVRDIYRKNGRFVVEWAKTCRDFDDNGERVERYDFDPTPFKVF